MSKSRETRDNDRGIGKAYGFFNCRASREEIEGELPLIREAGEVPTELKLSLYEGMDSFMNGLEDDPELIVIAQEAKAAGIRYVLDATFPEKSNVATADETAVVLTQIYQSQLFGDGETFRGRIAYKMDGKYVFRE